MKRILTTLLFISATLVVALSQNLETTCNLGFSFKISNNPNWGKGEPIVISVAPGSPADRAGLKINDIILEVSGNGTYLKPAATILSWFMQDDKQISMSVRNFETSFRQMKFAKDCRPRNAINEAQLAPVFAFYSLEDVQDRKFVMPVTGKANPDADFFNYRTFDFAKSDAASKDLDDRINAVFINALSKMGLKRDTQDPDFIIQTYYSYRNNPMYRAGTETFGSYQPVWRFDTRNKRIVKAPVYSPSEAVRIEDVMYDLEFGYRFYDRKFLNPGDVILIWESEVKERLNSNFGLMEYLEMNLPLMLMKFPNYVNPNFTTFHLKYAKYNYTGINYDMNDLRTVISVDANSPAARAGIKSGDVITKVQGHNFNHNSKQLTESYRRFIAETMKFRDKGTKFTDANGFQDAMYWDISHYYNIAQELSNTKRYKSGFSYLFNFNQYIDWNTPKVLEFEVKRDGEKQLFYVEPIVMKNSQISVE